MLDERSTPSIEFSLRGIEQPSAGVNRVPRKFIAANYSLLEIVAT